VGQVRLEVRVGVDRADAMRGLGASLAALPGVKRVEWSRAAEDEGE
jgi:hypothetical protein